MKATLVSTISMNYWYCKKKTHTTNQPHFFLLNVTQNERFKLVSSYNWGTFYTVGLKTKGIIKQNTLDLQYFYFYFQISKPIKNITFSNIIQTISD